MSKLRKKTCLREKWSDLNQELLEIIVSKLKNQKFPWQDIARFRSVCSSWLAAVQYPKPGPLLLFPSDQDDDLVHIGLFSVRDNVTWELNWNVPKSEYISFVPEEVRIVGSSHGWVVTMDESTNPHLYSLFSKNNVELPKKSAIQQLVSDYTFRFSPGYFRTLISKAILTGNPSYTPDYKVVIIHNSCRKLAFWCKGEDSWTGFSCDRDYNDVVWSDSDETLYAIRDEGCIIEGWKFSGNFPTRKLFMEFPLSLADLTTFSRDNCTTQSYLVPSKGNIFFVMRYIGEFVNEVGDILRKAELEDDDVHNCCYRTTKFRVFKVDMVRQKLEEVKSLQDEILFLGGNHSISLPSVECPGFKPNSIYFTDDFWDKMFEDLSYGGHDFGVFSLEDEKVVSDSNIVHRFEPIPFWVLTN